MYGNVTSTRNHITGSSLEVIEDTILHLSLQHTSLISSMLWSIDTCQNKVSADQYHVTISRAQVGPYRSQLFFSKLTADQGLVVDWIAGSESDTHTHTPERGLIFCALSVARRGYTAILRQQKLLTVDAFCVQVRFGKYIFLAFFAGFSPGLT